jgi:hypothetical protein
MKAEEVQALQERILRNGNKSQLLNVPAKKERKKPDHSESQLQQQCLIIFKTKYPKLLYSYTDKNGKLHTYCLLVKNCNEGAKSDVKRMIEYKEGLTPGLSDMSLKMPSFNKEYHGMEIEFKKLGAKNTQTEAQKAYQRSVEAQGLLYVLIDNV